MINFLCYCLAYKKTEIIDTPVVAITSLAPKVLKSVEDLARIKPYLDSLKKTIDDSEITNIALTGGYGSGKSTIIKTFRNQYPQYKYLNISLASFNEIKELEDENPEINIKTKDKESALQRQLEVSILQQIFYHVKPSEIPDSRFKRIINITQTKIWTFAIGLVLWVASTIILFNLEYIKLLNPILWDLNKDLDYFAPLPFILFFTGIGFFAKTVIRLFSNSKISKFTIKGELELGDTLDKSVFNEHLEEILYFFERTKFNVVIIEDLDRFESTDIFTKLREINTLLNNSNLINRDINFVYAIKDEMFTDKSERVKFFEYIIPVIPFINPSNAADQLAKLITEAKLEGVLSKDFTEDVVTFIDDIDMRLLTNIFHEYQIYRLNLSTDLNQDELFAIITYKNLFPNDFGELHKRGGNLYKFINGREKYINQLLIVIDTQITKFQDEDNKIEGEHITHIHELRSIYLSAIFTKFPNASGFLVNGQYMNFAELLDEDNFEQLIKNDLEYREYTHQYSNQYNAINRVSNVKFSDIENEINENFTLEQREAFITAKKNGKLINLKEQIAVLRKKKEETESMTIKQVFEKIEIEPHLLDFKDNLLIRNLLLNGYLNENYSDYISLFHAVNLTQEDNAFLRKVKSGINSPYDYKLTKLSNLTKKIALKYFERDVILNFDLLDHMSKNYSTNKKYYDTIIFNLSSGSDKSANFIHSYIEKRSDYRALFIKSISKNWQGFWDDISQKRNYTDDKINWYLCEIIRYADITDILSFNGSSSIDLYIEKQQTFLALTLDIDPLKVKEVLKNLNIKFTNLQIREELFKEIFDYIYNNNHYKINTSNISLLIKTFNPKIPENEINVNNYTTIMNSGCNFLMDYIDEDIEIYVKNVMLKLPTNTKESEQSLINLINHAILEPETKAKILSIQETIINDISDINTQDMRELIFNQESVSVTWSNILIYFDGIEEKELNTCLITFLNKPENYQILKKSFIKDGTDKEEAFTKSFIILIMHCDELTLEAYTSLIESVHYNWNSLTIADLDSKKVDYLIRKRKLNLTNYNYKALQENFLSDYYHITLIENNEQVFVKNMLDFTIDETEVRKLLESTILSDQVKIKIIQQVGEQMIIDNLDIAKITCRILALSPFTQVSYPLLISLFSTTGPIEHKIRVLNKQATTLSQVQITNLISSINKDYKEIFIKRHRPKFLINDYHNELFRNLTKIGLIKGYKVDNKDSTKYQVVANYS